MTATNIPWADKVWNPVTGCTACSPGCAHCYARTMAETRLRGRCGYDRDNPFAVTWHQNVFDNPKFGRPCRVFVGSMTDLFHDTIPDTGRLMIFNKCRSFPWHTFMVLTKRIENAVDYFERAVYDYLLAPNLWLGVSVCVNSELWKITELLKIPAAVRFVSFEPLLEPIMLPPDCRPDWLIAGGETGPKARPCDPLWLQDLWDFSKRKNIPFFFKKFGTVAERNPLNWALEHDMPRQFPKGGGA